MLSFVVTPATLLRVMIVWCGWFNSVYATRDHIMSGIPEKPWLSNDLFRRIINHSFTYKICCNVFLDESIKPNGRYVLSFAETFQRPYRLQSIDYKCQTYLLMGSSQEELINAFKPMPTTDPDVEILIIFNGDLNQNSSLLSTTGIFGNSRATIVSRSGGWMLSVGLNYRKFQEVTVTNYTNFVLPYQAVNLQGSQLTVATWYIPPFSYLSSSVDKMVEGVRGRYFLSSSENRTAELMGVEVELFLIIAEKLNFSWVLRAPDDQITVFGKPEGKKWTGGIIGMLYNDQVDLAFGDIWMDSPVRDYVPVTMPWDQLSIKFIVPRPRARINILALLQPFTFQVWLVVGLAILVECFNIWIRAKNDDRIPSKFTDYCTTLTTIISHFIGFGVAEKVRGLRAQLNLWNFCGFLMMIIYSSNLEAMLTKPDFEERVDTMKQFVDNGLIWGNGRPIESTEIYFDHQDENERQILDRFQLESSPEERNRKISQGNYGIIGRYISSSFFPEFPVDNSRLVNYRLMDESIARHYVCFSAQYWLRESLNKVIHHVRQSGIMDYHLHRIIDKKMTYNLRKVVIDNDYTLKYDSLGLKHLVAAFLLLIIGHGISMIIFYFEMTRGSKKSLMNIFKNIKETRGKKKKLIILRKTRFPRTKYRSTKFNKFLRI